MKLWRIKITTFTSLKIGVFEAMVMYIKIVFALLRMRSLYPVNLILIYIFSLLGAHSQSVDVTSIQWSDDNTLITTGRQDCSVRLWQITH